MRVHLALRRIAAVMLLSATFLSPSQAFEVPLILDGKDSIKEVIDKLQGALDSLIRTAGGEARLTMFRGFQMSRLLIGDLEAAYADSLELTFDGLDEQQRKVFEDARALLSSAEDSLHGDIQDINKTMSDLVAVLNGSFLGSNSPIVTRFEPAFLVPASVDNEVHISVSGFKLRSPDGAPLPKILIGETSYQAQGATDTGLDFVIPRSAFPQPDHTMEMVTVDLQVYQDTSPWFLGWLIKTNRPVTYQLLLNALPNKLGSYSVASTVPGEQQEQRLFTSPTLEVRAPDAGGTKERHDCFVPSAGFKFLTNSAAIVVTKKQGWYREQPDHRYNKGGIDWYEDRKSEDEICFQVVAKTDAKEDDATTAGHFTVQEVRTVAITEQRVSDIEELSWSADTHYTAIPNASEIISVTLFGDIVFQLGSTEAGDLPFLQIDPDARSGQVFLRPRRVWEQRWE